MEYVGFFSTILLYGVLFYDALQVCQQNHYHYSFVRKYYLKLIKNYDFLIIIFSILKLLFDINNILWACIIIDVFYLIYLFLWFKRKKIVLVKITKRVIRIILIIIVITVIEIYLINYNIIILMTALNLLLSLVFLIPIERVINGYYNKKAKDKLNLIKPLVIGITGSAGKTSVKNYLYQLLKEEKVTFKSPKSYNTVNGLSRAINEGLKYGTEIVILEYGARRKHDIDKLTKFIKPDIAIVTNILPQHLETFKNVENIMEEKFKLLKASNVAILNTDIIDTILPEKIKKITIGSKKNVDYKVDESLINEEGCSFKINGVIYKSSLLGRCNYENILMAISTCLYLGVNVKSLVFRVKTLQSVENRLEIKKINYNNKDITIINDSFNSNIKGFENAIEVLKYYSESKVIITPGIVEGGKNKEALNTIIARYIIKNKLDIIVVKSNVSNYYIKTFNEYKYNYKLCDSFNLAFEEAIDNYNVVLIENDISDIYKY